MNTDFYTANAPYAVAAGKSLKMDPAAILAQWAYESGEGTNPGSKYFNLAGINITKNSVSGAYAMPNTKNNYAAYPNLSTFTQDYIRVMSSKSYSGIRAAAKPGATDPAAVARQISASPYSTEDYSTPGYVRLYNKAVKVVGGTPAADLSEKKTDLCLCRDCQSMACRHW